MSTPIVTRFAPSPTGFMHIGGVRTALYAYLAAAQSGGTFILRIEDTDKAREVEGSIEHIKESLTWLGIEWQYGPDTPGPWGSNIQSERLDTYRAAAQQLIDKGLAYPDPYSAEELEVFRAEAQAAKRPFLYRDHRPDTFAEWDGTKPLRFKTPEIKRYQWQDAVRGELEAGEEMLDDFIIMKSDGYPTYNFAHIIDDHAMGVTHVMRGDEFISSTPKFLSLYDALEIPYPTFVSLPPILAADGKKKLGKRDGAKDLLEYRAEGYLPEAMNNFLALIGWNPGTDQEIFSTDELLKTFSIDRIHKSGGAFNEEKLLWMNKQHLQQLDPNSQAAYAAAALPEATKALPKYTEERLWRLLPSIMERVHIAGEITVAAEAGEYDWAFSTPSVEIAKIAWKNDDGHEAALPRLQKAAELIEAADFATPDTIKAALWDYAEEVGKGEVLWPLRVTLTGRERSPDPFTCAWILGKEETLERIGTVTNAGT